MDSPARLMPKLVSGEESCVENPGRKPPEPLCQLGRIIATTVPGNYGITMLADQDSATWFLRES